MGVEGKSVTRDSLQKDMLQREQETSSTPRRMDFDLWRVSVLRNELINHNLYNQGLRRYVMKQRVGCCTHSDKAETMEIDPVEESKFRGNGRCWVEGSCPRKHSCTDQHVVCGERVPCTASARGVTWWTAGMEDRLGSPGGKVLESVFYSQRKVSPDKSYHFLSCCCC